MDGRAFTGGEMDRMMMILALSNCFCSVWQCLILGDVWVAGDEDPAIWIDLDQFVVMFGATVLFHITTNHSQVSPLSNLFPTAKTPGLSEREREKHMFPHVLSWAPLLQSTFLWYYQWSNPEDNRFDLGEVIFVWFLRISASQKYPCSRPATFDEYAAAHSVDDVRRQTDNVHVWERG